MGVFPINLSNINNSINNENALVLKYTFLLKISDYLTKRNEKKIKKKNNFKTVTSASNNKDHYSL